MPCFTQGIAKSQRVDSKYKDADNKNRTGCGASSRRGHGTKKISSKHVKAGSFCTVMCLEHVYVYCGEGAGQRSILSTIDSLKRDLTGLKVRTIDTLELLQCGWQKNCRMLCMPGGADLPYCRHLNGEGNKIIKEFVANGGAYLGLCAGAYYACARIEFELDTRLEVKGNRELAFFPGVAKGAVFPGFCYQTEAGTRAAAIRFKGSKNCEWHSCCDYSNGGPAFMRDTTTVEDSDDTIDLARYSEEVLGVAAVRCKVGKGVAVLCATHPELHPKWLEAACEVDSVQAQHPELSEGRVTELVAIAKKVRHCLEISQPARAALWRMLLSEAGLAMNLLPNDSK